MCKTPMAAYLAFLSIVTLVFHGGSLAVCKELMDGIYIKSHEG